MFSIIWLNVHISISERSPASEEVLQSYNSFHDDTL